MFGLRRKALALSQSTTQPERDSDPVEEVTASIWRHIENGLRHADQQVEDRKRQEWFTSRLWHNGAHAQCCPKCLQAGYVMALVKTGRLDLLGEYPELIALYQELRRDGMLQPVMAKAH